MYKVCTFFLCTPPPAPPDIRDKSSKGDGSEGGELMKDKTNEIWVVVIVETRRASSLRWRELMKKPTLARI